MRRMVMRFVNQVRRIFIRKTSDGGTAARADASATPIAVTPSGSEGRMRTVAGEEFFAGLRRKGGPIYRFVAVPRGKIRGDEGTVMFEYPQRMVCGTLLNAAKDGQKFVVLERKTTGRTAVAPEPLIAG